ACGNPQMIEHAKGVFKRAGLQAEFICEEKYYTETTPKQVLPKPTLPLAPGPVYDVAEAQVAARRAKPPGTPKTKGTGKRPPLPPGLAKLKAVKPGRTGGAPPRISGS
ncbi:MAG: hypothetical protein AAFX41_16965, partial [Bacteroidota bacterium]